jgi:hypothetical protein
MSLPDVLLTESTSLEGAVQRIGTVTTELPRPVKHK